MARTWRSVPRRGVNLVSQKMGIHEWSYDNDVSPEQRYKVPWQDKKVTLRDIKVEVELGFDPRTGFAEAQRCLNCDVQTVFTPQALHRVRRVRRHLPDGLHHVHAERRGAELRQRLTAPALHLEQSLYVSEALKTGRIMAKDEDVCLHCGLCAERCPTGAWDMQKFLIDMTHAGPACRNPQRKAA